MSVFEEKEYSKRFDFGLWKKLFGFAKPYKATAILLGLIMAAVAGVDVIFPLMTKYAIDNFVVSAKFNGIWGFGLLYLSLIVVQAVNIWLLIAIAGKIETYVCYDIRKAGFKKLQELSFSYYDTTPVGWIMARMTSDSQKIGDTLAWGIVDFVWGSTMMIGTIFVLLFLNWKLALITLSVLPILIVISLYFQDKILGTYRLVRKTNSKITGAFNEGIMGAKTTKTLSIEKDNLKDFQILTKKMQSSSLQAAIFSSLYLPVILSIGSIGTALALFFGGKNLLAGSISFGTLIAFISYTIQFLNQYEIWQDYLVSFNQHKHQEKEFFQ